MPNPVIISAVRTPIGTSFKGTLRALPIEDLSTPVIAAAVERAGIPPQEIDDVILAESLYGGGDLARLSALRAGLTGVPGVAVNRHCAGGLASVLFAAGSIATGNKCVVAGGAQSSSTAPLVMLREDPETAWTFLSHPSTEEAPAHDMSITVGWNTARSAGITREEQDRWALRSHQRAIAAAAAGQFDDELVALAVPSADGSTTTFAADEHPRATTSAEKLAALPPLHPEIDGFSVTAGNASGVNDGAAAVVVASAGFAADYDCAPLAEVLGGATVGIEPARTGFAAIFAIRKALSRLGLTIEDIDVWEINEAFACVPLAAVRELRLDETTVNPFGSGCSLGHPVAATGARMVATLAHELRRRGGGTAVAAMCAGGGMGSAVVLRT